MHFNMFFAFETQKTGAEWGSAKWHRSHRIGCHEWGLSRRLRELNLTFCGLDLMKISWNLSVFRRNFHKFVVIWGFFKAGKMRKKKTVFFSFEISEKKPGAGFFCRAESSEPLACVQPCRQAPPRGQFKPTAGGWCWGRTRVGRQADLSLSKARVRESVLASIFQLCSLIL